MKQVVFRTKGITPLTWRIQQSSVFADKEGRLVEINYFKGRKSIYVEDNEGVKPTLVPLFEFNDSRNQTELIVDAADKVLIEFLKNHGHFNKRFEIFSEEAEATKQLTRFEQIDLANEKVKDLQGSELIAMAMLVFGLDSLNKDEKLLKVELRKVAFDNPQAITNKTEKSNFENVHTGSLAIAAGIVKVNNTLTSIQWTDSNKEIISIAKGEEPIEKFGEFLSSNTDEAKLVLQSIGERLQKSPSNQENINSNEPNEDLKNLQEQYLAKFEKPVPNAFKNNVEWITEKLAEEQE